LKNTAAEYTIGHSIGSGGYGNVVLVKRVGHPSQDLIAKRFKTKGSDGIMLALEEAIVAEAVRHPNIVSIKDAFLLSGSIHLVYENGGTDLQGIIDAGPISTADMRSVVLHVASGLQHMHGKQIVHADVKPPNIIVDRRSTSWTVRLTDLGLACEVGVGAYMFRLLSADLSGALLVV
jgi:serine/threonine protein kinase